MMNNLQKFNYNIKTELSREKKTGLYKKDKNQENNKGNNNNYKNINNKNSNNDDNNEKTINKENDIKESKGVLVYESKDNLAGDITKNEHNSKN